MWKWLLAFLMGTNSKRSDSATLGGMSEGDVHSGPHGYSPNTAYPDTEYGDADWEAEEH